MAKKAPVSDLDQHVGYWLRFVSNHVSHSFKQKVESQGVTVAEWVLMRRMQDAGQVNPSQLAERLGMTRGTISKLIERLCQKKLAARSTADRDRRFQTVKLTPKGKRLVPTLAKLADKNDREFFGHLPAQVRDDLVSLLQEIVQKHEWIDLPTT